MNISVQLTVVGVVAAFSFAIWLLALCRYECVKRRARKSATTSTPTTVPGAYQIIREMIRHEDDLMNQRLMWLLTLEGLLFATLGFVWGKPAAASVVFTVSTVGIVAAASTTVALHFAQVAVLHLRLWWDQRKPTTDGPPVIGYHEEWTFLGYAAPWRLIPLLLMIGWLAMTLLAA